MSPDDFTLQPSDQPQPKLHDGECATRDWPMPAPQRWAPTPQTAWPAGLLQDDNRGLSRWLAGRLDAVRRLVD